MLKALIAVAVAFQCAAGANARPAHCHHNHKMKIAIIPPPPAVPISAANPEMLSFREQCALAMYKRLVEEKGSLLTPDEMAKLAWDYADSMQSLRNPTD